MPHSPARPPAQGADPRSDGLARAAIVAAELREVFERNCRLAQVFYAVKQLQEAGMVEATSVAPVRDTVAASYHLREPA